MVAGCGNSCVKITLGVVNVIVCLFGVSLLALGIWGVASVGCEGCTLGWLWKYDCKENVTATRTAADWTKDVAVLDNKSFKLAEFAATATTKRNCTKTWSNNADSVRDSSWGVIVVGALLSILGLLGCCGAFMENRLMLGGYSVLVLIAAILQIIFAVILLMTLPANGPLHQAVGDVVRNLTDSDLYDMQQALHCCGDKFTEGDHEAKPRPSMSESSCYPHPKNETMGTKEDRFQHGCPDILWVYIVAIVASTASVCLVEVGIDAIAICFACVLIVAIGKQRVSI